MLNLKYVTDKIKNIGLKILELVTMKPIKYALLLLATLFIAYEIILKFTEVTALKYDDIGFFGFLLIVVFPFVLASFMMYLVALWMKDDYLKNNFGKINIFGIVAVVMLLIIFDLIVNMTMDKNIFGVFQHTKTFADFNTSDGWTQRGQWGDMLSGHFSALAFIALALSIYIQNKTLKVQQEELDRQKEELKLQRNHDTFKTIMEMIGSIELKIGANVINFGGNKIKNINDVHSYLETNKRYSGTVLTYCGSDMTELESVSKAIEVLSKELTQKQKEIINIKIQKFVVVNRSTAMALIINQVFRYFECELDEKEKIFSDAFFINISDIGKELMLKAEYFAKKIELEGYENPKDEVVKYCRAKEGAAIEVLQIADKYLGIK